MAKVKPKPARPKQGGDVLKVTLKLLAGATKETIRAVKFLGKAAETPIDLPVPKICKFAVGTQKRQREAHVVSMREIQEAVDPPRR